MFQEALFLFGQGTAPGLRLAWPSARSTAHADGKPSGYHPRGQAIRVRCWPITPKWGDRQVWLITGNMKSLFIFMALMTLAISPARAGAQPDIYSTDFGEITGKAGNDTWVEINNRKEAQTNGVAHISVITRTKGAPVWKIEWVCPHIAITTDALKRSVIRPFKARAVYPEAFYEAYGHWKTDKKKGPAVICSTSVQDFLKKRQ